MFTAPPPPASPGPVAALPARSVSPCGTKFTPAVPRLVAPGVLPLVIVMAAFMFMSPPAQNKAFPSVVVMGPFAFKFRPALNKRLPRVIVTAAVAATLISRPQHTTKFPSTAVTAALMLTSRAAVKVRVVGTPLLVQLTASLTKISPLPGPGAVVMEMLLVTS